MRLLVTNDDGIDAPGLARLARAAAGFGEVYIVAPMQQCSAMSHRITIREEIRVEEVPDFPAPCKAAFRIGGTPADCVKVAVEYLMDGRPDCVLSGINDGYNAGMDLAYSGTVAAAMEAVMKGLPAIAVSKAREDEFGLVDAKLDDILRELLETPAGAGRMWNVNFPQGAPAACKGIMRDCAPAKALIFPDAYGVIREDETGKTISLQHTRAYEFEEHTDLYALEHGYIAIGTVRNMIMG